MPIQVNNSLWGVVTLNSLVPQLFEMNVRVFTWIWRKALLRMPRFDSFLSSMAGSCFRRNSKHSRKWARRFFSNLLWTSRVPALFGGSTCAELNFRLQFPRGCLSPHIGTKMEDQHYPLRFFNSRSSSAEVRPLLPALKWAAADEEDDEEEDEAAATGGGGTGGLFRLARSKASSRRWLLDARSSTLG